MVHCVCQTKATYRINKNNWLKKRNFLNRVFLLQPIFMLTAISLKQKKNYFFWTNNFVANILCAPAGGCGSVVAW